MTATTPGPGPEASAPRPSFGLALAFWFKLGCISFGGPAGQIALMHAELVERRRWISERRFLHALNFCMVLPGPEAQQLATYIGWLMHRTRGGIAAGALFVLPSLALLIALSWVYMAHGDVPAVAGIFYGIKPAVTALVVHAAWRIGARTLRHPLLWTVAVAAFAALFVFNAPFPLIVLLAGVAGWLGSRVWPAAFEPAGHGGRPPGASAGPAFIDDDTPAPAHARFTWRRFAAVLAVGTGLWAAAIGALAWVLGPQAVLVQMAWFFTKAALLTFGGAYAVLPYVVQGAVEQQAWLTAQQMLDGLALGETTPGPLIMVVAFVGFVGGWTRSLFGPDALLLAGAAAAVVVTGFTFLPSFVFILLGGPFIETTHGRLALTAPLAAITAAVVGVIANLALFFAVQVLWPAGLGGARGAGLMGWALPDLVALTIGMAAAWALFSFKRSVIEVVLGAGAAGLCWTLGSSLLR